MGLYRLLHLQGVFCRKTGRKRLKQLIFRLKCGNPALPRDYIARFKMQQVQKTVSKISRLETCMTFQSLLHLQGVFCRKTSRKGLKQPVFRLKSGNTAYPRDYIARLKVPQVHKTVGMNSRLETCMAFQSLHIYKVFFAEKQAKMASNSPFSGLKVETLLSDAKM